MEYTLILIELAKIRTLLYAYAVLSALMLGIALVGIGIYMGKRFDKFMDEIDKEDGGQ